MLIEETVTLTNIFAIFMTVLVANWYCDDASLTD